MYGFDRERRGLFDGLRVPLDQNMIILAMLAVVFFRLGVWGIEIFTQEPFLLERMFHPYLDIPVLGWFVESLSSMLLANASWGTVLGALEGRNPQELAPITYVCLFGWMGILWAFFSGGIHRIAALSIAREEGLELKRAMGFSKRKFLPNLACLIILPLLAAILWLVCNASIAGWVGRIPWVGDILLGVLFFLVMLSTFLIVGAVGIQVFSVNMMAASVATEDSDVYEGITRAVNYVLARPWQVFLYFTLTAMWVGLFLVFSSLFVSWTVESLTVGEWWGLGEEEERAAFDESEQRFLAIPGKGEYLRGLVAGEYTFNHVYYRTAASTTPEYLDRVHTLEGELTALQDERRSVTNDRLEAERAGRPATKLKERQVELQRRIRDQNELLQRLQATPTLYVNFDRRQDVSEAIPTNYYVLGAMVSFWIALAKLIILGVVLAYFSGANTLMYFLLRKDYDGEDYSEIVVREEEEEPFLDIAEPAFPPDDFDLNDQADAVGLVDADEAADATGEEADEAEADAEAEAPDDEAAEDASDEDSSETDADEDDEDEGDEDEAAEGSDDEPNGPDTSSGGGKKGNSKKKRRRKKKGF